MSLALQSQTWFPTHVQVTVLQAKNLRSKGKAGTNDAYAIIQLGKEKYSTTVSEKSLAPVWKEEASFEVPLLHNNNQERCTVHIIVMHRALVGMDKFLGQLDLNLWEMHQTKNRRKVQWYPLKSKPGKKEKDRGQIEVEVEFKRNNMTASMFDLSMKEKSRSPFGKLKDKIKGKHSDGLPDTASAIVPSMNQYGDDSDDDGMPDGNKKKSKLKNLFSKPGLKKNSMSQSMSVLPTLPPSPSQRTVLKPGDFSSEFNQASGSPVSERRFPHFPTIMTHKRTASADTKQLSQVTSGNKKEGLSFFTGMKSKNDPITRSNLCINGNHVYMEETEPKNDSPKDNSLTNSPQIIRKNPMYASAENLTYKPSKEMSSTSSNIPDKGMTSSSSNSSLKSNEWAKSESSLAEDSKYRGPFASSDLPKESKESKKQESKKSSLLSLVTGRKETPKTSDVEQFSDVALKKEEPKTNGTRQPTDVQTKKKSSNPFEEDIEESKPEPIPSERNAKTSAVKPRLDVSSEAETKARLSSSSLSGTSFLAASFYGGQGTPEADSSNIPQSTYISHSLDKGPSPPTSPTLSEGNKESTAEPEKPSMSLFWRSGISSTQQSESKEVNVVAPFTEKNKPKRTYVKTLLDQLKGKPSHTENENVVDADLVRGILPVLSETSSFYEERQALPENNSTSGFGGFGINQEDEESAPPLDGKDITLLSTESNKKASNTVKEVPIPTPRVQSATKKDSEDEKPVPPKPAPRSAKLNKNQDPVSDCRSAIQPPQPKERSSSDNLMEKAPFVGVSPVDSLTNMKMTTSMEDYSFRLDELPVIPENPEGTSDDEQLDVKDDKMESSLNSSVNTNSDSKMYKNGQVKSDLSEKSSTDNDKDMADKLTSGNNSSDSKVTVKMSDSAHQPPPETVPSQHTFPSSSPSYSIPSDKPSAPSVESPTIPTIDVSDKVEGTGKKKLLRAWVSPSETHPIPTVQSGGTVSSRQRTNPVKPMNAQNKNLSSFPQAIKSHENAIIAYNPKKYDPSDPAAAFAQLTHDELIQLVLKQRDIISRKDAQVRELEDYIDNLLVRVMEETPNILRSGSKKIGRI